MTNDTELLAEYVRQALSIQIAKQFIGNQYTLHVMTLSPEIENMFTSNIQQTEHGNYLALDPQIQEKIVQNVYQQLDKLSLEYDNIVILCSPTIRMYVKQLIERTMPHVAVLSYNELEPNVQVQRVGVVEVARSEEHTSELQSRFDLVCRLLLE